MDNISEIYSDYSDVIECFGEKETKQFYMNLFQSCEDFIKRVKVDDYVKINTRVLTHSVMDCITDLVRLSEFHHINQTNEYKKLAYETYWFLRRKPIQILNNDEDLVFINEKFLLSYTLSVLTNNLDLQISTTDITKKSFEGFLETYYYYLKYRDCNPRALEMIYLSFSAGGILCNSRY